MVVLNGDSRAARAAIHVNPLVIAGRVGELVDARLRDLQPVADGDLLADPVAQRADVEFDHDAIRHGLSAVPCACLRYVASREFAVEPATLGDEPLEQRRRLPVVAEPRAGIP